MKRLCEALIPEEMILHFACISDGVRDNVLLARLDELIKFLMISSKLSAGPVPISQELDALWHAYILETRAYAALCATLGAFIHHSAVMADTPAPTAGERQTANMAFVVAYVAQFGRFPDGTHDLWPALAELRAHLAIDMDELMRFAAELGALGAL